MVCEPWQVVVVPFPFSDRTEAKKRPALVLSKRKFNQRGRSILAMITTSVHEPWLGDSYLRDYAEAGLEVPCKVRLKLFTLDNRLILRVAGRLSVQDEKQVADQLQANFA